MEIKWSENSILTIHVEKDVYFNFGSEENISWIVCGGKVNQGGFTATSRALIPIRLTIGGIPNDIKRNIKNKKEVIKIGNVIRKYLKKEVLNKRYLSKIVEDLSI